MKCFNLISLQSPQKAGLSVRDFAKLIGMNPNSLSNYAHRGESELPSHIALIAVLVSGVAEKGGDYRRTMSKVVLAPKKPRGGAKRGHFGGDLQQVLDLCDMTNHCQNALFSKTGRANG